jgi:diaminopimelate epimerase
VTRIYDVAFTKGHGTGNDFVVIPDLDDAVELTEARIQWLCDRRQGIGADGVLRIVRTAHIPGFADFAAVAEYFMDYRNADGTQAEMCGNGIRVFARYLTAAGLVEFNEFVIATRSGLVTVAVSDDLISVAMGQPRSESASESIQVHLADRNWRATAVHIPNPHAVVVLDPHERLVDLGEQLSVPDVQPPFPNGANVEFVEMVAPGHVRMRVHERGVGETWSCGTGACAAAWVAAQVSAPQKRWQVDVPGGTVWVEIDAVQRLTLFGPAQLVARGVFQWPRHL